MSFRRSLTFAFDGLRHAFRHERNFRVHTVLALLAIILSASLRVSPTEWLFVLTAIASVIVLEIVNTIFERLVDAFQPRVHPAAATIKDLTAAAVLVASLSAALVGTIIFVPRLIAQLT